jgi:hypothetical protein
VELSLACIMRRRAPFVAEGAEHVIIYHLLTEGRASAHVEGGEPLTLDAGDVVIFPDGDPHIIENGRPMKSVDLSQELARILSQGLTFRAFGKRSRTAGAEAPRPGASSHRNAAQSAVTRSALSVPFASNTRWLSRS